MTATLSVTLPRLHSAQWQIVQSPARFRVAACGRRFGKTLAACGVAAREAIRGGVVWWVAPSYDVTRIGWRGMLHIAKQIPGHEVRLADRMIVFPGGGYMQFKTANTHAGLRGEGLNFLVIDEAAFVPETAWRDDLRPALSDKLGRALFISTPFGRNWFWRAWLRGQDDAYPDWQSWQFATGDNPYIRPDEIDAARRLLPERTFQQEYLATFEDDAGAVFRNLSACVKDVAQDEPVEGHDYIFGVDWAREQDFTAIAVMDATANALVHMERFNQVSWALQRGRLAELAERFQPRVIWAEANSIGGPNIEALQADGLPVSPFTTTTQSKGPLIESLALAFERGEIAMYPDPVTMGELQAYTMARLPSGRFRYEAPTGMHDDTVIALALAWYGVIMGSVGIAFS